MMAARLRLGCRVLDVLDVLISAGGATEFPQHQISVPDTNLPRT